MVRKLQLNERQWKTLEALFEARAQRLPTDSIKVPDRLHSNGLVAQDRRGGTYLTEQGRERLRQGR